MRSQLAGALPFLLQLLLATTTPVIHKCPSKCTCDEWLLLRHANCTSVHTHSVYIGVSDDVQALDLFNNSISSLQDKDLMRSGLTQLRYLNLSFNIISEITKEAFFKIDELAVLDLSSNSLEHIDPDTFRNNNKLQILKLNFNKFNIEVPKLYSSSIKELGLQGCRISSIPSDTFSELPNLKILDISYNFIRHLEPQVFASSPYLETIYLQENQWTCNHSMRVFTEYLTRRDINFQRVCKIQKVIMKQLESIPDKYYKDSYGKERISNTWNSNNNLKILEDTELSSMNILRNLITVNSTDVPKEVTVAKMKDLSPYWLVAIGFLLGSAVTIVITYVLLSTTISCFHPLHRRCLCDSTVDGVSQRVSLLHNFWQTNGIDVTDSGQRPACPGTPPPPYREVMLHRNLYPNPATRTNNADHATCT